MSPKLALMFLLFGKQLQGINSPRKWALFHWENTGEKDTSRQEKIISGCDGSYHGGKQGHISKRVYSTEEHKGTLLTARTVHRPILSATFWSWIFYLFFFFTWVCFVSFFCEHCSKGMYNYTNFISTVMQFHNHCCQNYYPSHIHTQQVDILNNVACIYQDTNFWMKGKLS